MRTTAARFTGSIFGAALVVATLVAQGGQQQPAPAQPPPPTEQPADEQPVFRAGINFVRVDVIVTDKQGNPVVDLKQEDFEILEDNKRQAVETFRLVKIDTQRPMETRSPIRTRNEEETAAANEDARIFVFFLDDYHVRLGNSMASRRPLTEFVQNQVAGNDLLAVMYPLAPLDTVTLTRDHASVIRMLERFEGRKFNYTPRNSAEERYAQQPTEVVETIRRQVSLSALEGLAVKLGSLREGRKAIVLVSEGYTALLPPQLRDQNAQMPGMGNPNRGNPTAGEGNIYEDRAKFGASLDVQRELQNVFDAANRNNTAIYSVDPRGLATGEFDINENVGFRTSNESLTATQDTLRILSDETDGRAIVNRNDLAKGMQQIMRDSSAYYLLGYNSSQAPQDGKFHAIKVRVKRPGTQIRARKGYWALSPAETKAAIAPPKPGPPPAINRALASLVAPSTARFVRTWVGTSAGEAGKTKVTFVWEPLPVAPGTRRGAPRDVTLLVASPEGEVVFRGDVGAAATANGNGGAAAPLGAALGNTVSFDAPPGKLELRMTVRGADKETLDTEDREIVVPDLTATDVRIGTPRLFVARNAREFQQLSQDPSATPTAGRDFRRTDRLIVRVDAFGPGDGTTITSRLLNRQGQRMVDVPVTRGEGSLYVIDLPLSSLAPGEYLLEVAAAADGQQPVTELVAFKVGT
jgi:VWFA-related protein